MKLDKITILRGIQLVYGDVIYLDNWRIKNMKLDKSLAILSYSVMGLNTNIKIINEPITLKLYSFYRY